MQQEDRLVRIGRPGKPQHRRPDNAPEGLPPVHAIGGGRLDIADRNGTKRTIENLAAVGRGVQEQHDQRAKPGTGQPACLHGDFDKAEIERHPHLWQDHEQLVGDKELDEEGRAAKQENEPGRRQTDERVRGVLADRQRHCEPEADGKRHGREIDVPDHPAADQHHLLAQREVALWKQPLADAEGPQAVCLNGLDTTHRPSIPRPLPASVPCPVLKRALSRASAISLNLVRPR